MNKLLSKLPLLAFVLAATFAFGAQVPALLVSEPPTKEWTPDENEPLGYRDITGEVPGIDYDCVGEDEHCRVAFTDDDPVNGTMTVLQEGIYTP